MPLQDSCRKERENDESSNDIIVIDTALTRILNLESALDNSMPECKCAAGDCSERRKV